jgi:O-acetyl-ADP-ribose deacetylase (regulator of RNase III)
MIVAKGRVGGDGVWDECGGHMITHVTGDLLLSRAQAIAHGIAPNDHFDSGLALSLRQDWPALYKDFRHYLHTAHPKPGGLWVWTAADGRRIVNLFTQEPAPSEHARPGKASYHNLNLCLRELHKWAEQEKITSLALPRLATGVGGLEWEQVEPLIRQHLGGLGIPIQLYTTYQKGAKAA